MKYPPGGVPKGNKIRLQPDERAAFVKRQIRQAEKLLASAKDVNKQPDRGHIAAGLLYDCLEALAQACIAHSGAPLPDHHDGNVHNRRRSQYEALYKGKLPRAHNALRVILRRRNAARYVEAGSGLPPWEIREFRTERVQSHIDQMVDYLEDVKALVSKPYKPPT